MKKRPDESYRDYSWQPDCCSLACAEGKLDTAATAAAAESAKAGAETTVPLLRQTQRSRPLYSYVQDS
ncbi:MAG: hypothetical protein ACLR78_05520 [Roseburia sp.]